MPVLQKKSNSKGDLKIRVIRNNEEPAAPTPEDNSFWLGLIALAVAFAAGVLTGLLF